MSTINKIIIVGSDHHNTLGLIRSLSACEIDVELVKYGPDSGYVKRCKHLTRYYTARNAFEAIDTVYEMCRKMDSRPVVLASTDEASSLMDQRYGELEKYCFFFNAGKSGRITQYMNKKLQSILAVSCGFAEVPTQECLPEQVDTASVRYPCLLKPSESIHGGKHIAICTKESELRKALHEYDQDHTVLVQDYLEKDFEIVILGASYMGRHIIPAYVHKHREVKGGTTYSTVMPIRMLDNRVVEACKGIIDEIGYSGLWGIECIVKEGKYYFLELNMRNDATSFAATVAGANLPHAYVRMCEGTCADFDEMKVDETNAMVEFEDFNFVLKRQVGLRTWISQLKGAKCLYFYDSHDLAPFFHKILRYLKFLGRRALHI